MTGTSTATARFFTGFGTAAMALGALLVLVWFVLWALEAIGGPDLRMPARLLQSGGALVLIGYVLRLLLQARAAPTDTKKE